MDVPTRAGSPPAPERHAANEDDPGRGIWRLNAPVSRFARPGGQGGASELDLPGERRQLGREDVARSSPAADPGRSRSLASTTVVIDDAETLTGTTHLWRRGLSFDSPFAAAVFDAALAPGRPDPTANPNQNPIVTDEDAWNPDGSLRPGFNPATLMANDIHDEFNDPTPSSASLRRAGAGPAHA